MRRPAGVLSRLAGPWARLGMATLAVALWGGSPALAQTVRAVTELNERLDPQAYVSGSFRIHGVVETRGFDTGLGSQTGGFALRAEPGQICLRYRSRNGLYAATQVFETEVSGWVTVPFSTAHADRLESLPGTGFSVQAELAEDCSDATADRRLAPVALPAFVPAGTEDPAGEYYLVVQSDRNPAWIVVEDGSGAAPQSVQCLPIDGAGLIAFDTKCPLPGAAFSPGAKVTLILLTPDDRQLREPIALSPR
ncbi:hypothetical protein RGUI_1240 [Rhodovulum sp. P5]|uniref:hypothetical protein n=1 Tax=Rhodovulum sp. P5 TaxID=1564506 RepID=UPI0009C3402D|nr:hypothetical protein [Rhodovulum sp. P5]ARE39381.1 hypothetical protein RGUI_1240 [Rhodovulum sp. P5]